MQVDQAGYGSSINNPENLLVRKSSIDSDFSPISQSVIVIDKFLCANCFFDFENNNINLRDRNRVNLQKCLKVKRISSFSIRVDCIKVESEAFSGRRVQNFFFLRDQNNHITVIDRNGFRFHSWCYFQYFKIKHPQLIVLINDSHSWKFNLQIIIFHQ
jgi:hypothetical protein